MSSDRERLLGDRSPRPGNGSKYGSAVDGHEMGGRSVLALQQSAFREQDEQLDELSGGVRGVRDVAELLSNEAASQNRALDNLIADVEAADNRTKRATIRASSTERNPYSLQNFCLLLWPLVLLIILIIGAIRHFVFG